MVTFPTPDSILSSCALGSDSDTGGYSTASLDHVVEDGIPCLKFHGNLSLHVSTEARARGMTHSGWAGWRAKPLKSLFNRYYCALIFSILLFIYIYLF
jgi:Complex I intermediate-associated protein 30 (CIA30)